MGTYTEDLLLEICQKLQLQPSSYDLATERYKTISEILQADSAFKGIELKMYSQGSFRLKTTVKPIQDEYDLDFVVEIPQFVNMTAKELYDHIVRILKNDGYHNEMVELKSRCVRVSYANDFHMDIMPGKSIGRGTEIQVPDRDLKAWQVHHSNPKAYAEWFEGNAIE